MTVLGSTQTVVVCVSGSGGIQGACPTGSIETVTQAYLVSPTNASFLDLSAESFDPATAGAYFSFALFATLAFYMTIYGAGQIVQILKRH